MSLLGFLFGFGAKDQGLKKGLGQASSGIGGINDQLREQNRLAAASVLPGLYESLKSISLDNITNAVEGLSNGADNLSSSLESFNVGAEKAIKPVLSRLGLAGKELKEAKSEIKGIAYALDVDAGQVTEGFVALQEAGIDTKQVFKDMGFGLKDLIKLEQASGISTKDLTDVVGDLTKSWGFSSEATSMYLNDLIALGREAGIGSLGLSKLGDFTKTLDEVFAQSGIAKSADEVDGLQKSVIRLSGAFRGIGTSAEGSFESSLGLFRKLSEEMVTAEKLGRGQAEDWGGLSQGLMQLGPLSWVEEMIKLDPLTFVQKLNDKYQEIVDSKDPSALAAFDRLREQLQEVSPDLVYLVTNLDKGKSALEKMAKVAPDSTGALKKLAKDGGGAVFTLQEQLDRMKDGFEAKLRNIGRKEIHEFVEGQRRGYADLGRIIEEASSDPVWGPLTKRLAVIPVLGWRALLPTSELGARFGLLGDSALTLAGELQPLATILVGMSPLIGKVIDGGVGLLKVMGGLVVSAVGWPVLIGGAIVAGLGALVYFWPEVKAAMIDGLDWMTNWLKEIPSKIGSLDAKALSAQLVGWIKSSLDEVVKWFDGAGDGSELSQAFSRFASSFGEAFTSVKGFGNQFLSALIVDLEEFAATYDWGGLWSRIVGFAVKHRSTIEDGALLSINPLLFVWKHWGDEIIENGTAWLDDLSKIDWKSKLSEFGWKVFDTLVGEAIPTLLNADAELRVTLYNWLLKSMEWAADNVFKGLDVFSTWLDGFDETEFVESTFKAVEKWFDEVFAKMVTSDALSGGADKIADGMIKSFDKFDWNRLLKVIEKVSIISFKLGLIFEKLFRKSISLSMSAMAKWFPELMFYGLKKGFEGLLFWNEAIGQLMADYVIMPMLNTLKDFGIQFTSFMNDFVLEPIRQFFSDFGIQTSSFVDDMLVTPFMSFMEWIGTFDDKFLLLLEENVITPLRDASVKVKDAGAALIENLKLGMEEKWNEFKEFFMSKGQWMRDLLPGSEPKLSESPLRGLGDAGEAYLGNIEDGFMGKASDFQATLVRQLEQASTAGTNAFVENGIRLAEDRMNVLTGSLADMLERELYRLQDVRGGGRVEITEQDRRSYAVVLQSDFSSLKDTIKEEGVRMRRLLQEIADNTAQKRQQPSSQPLTAPSAIGI